MMTIPADATIADEALALALAWGEDFMKPTQARLAAKYPELTAAQLDEYDAIAREAMTACNTIVVDEIGRQGQGATTLGSVCRRLILERYPWVSTRTFQMIFSQGQYYAWHDGIGA